MSEKVGDLAGREGFYRAVGLRYAVYERGCEGVAQRVQTLNLDSGGFEDPVKARGNCSAACSRRFRRG